MAKLLREAEAYAMALASYDDSPFPYYDLKIEIKDPYLTELVEQMSPELAPNVPQRRSPQRGAKHEMRMQGKLK
ncbi:hypothetical protein D3C77_548760 [compost metagenome]